MEAKELAASLSLETVTVVSCGVAFGIGHVLTTVQMMQNVLNIHDGDPNFPFVTLQNIKRFLGKASSSVRFNITNS